MIIPFKRVKKNHPPLPESIATLRDWWDRQRGFRRMPRRSELDPAALVRALPDLMIIDVTPGHGPGSHVFTYRLAGTRVEDRLGLMLKGRMVEAALFGHAAPSIQEFYETVIAERRPLLHTQHAIIGGARHVEYQGLVTPLSSEDGTQIVALVAAVHFICAYRVEEGRPPFCRGSAACDRKDLCVPSESCRKG